MSCVFVYYVYCMFTRSLIGILKAFALCSTHTLNGTSALICMAEDSVPQAEEQSSLERLGKEVCEHAPGLL